MESRKITRKDGRPVTLGYMFSIRKELELAAAIQHDGAVTSFYKKLIQEGRSTKTNLWRSRRSDIYKKDMTALCRYLKPHCLNVTHETAVQLRDDLLHEIAIIEKDNKKRIRFRAALNAGHKRYRNHKTGRGVSWETLSTDIDGRINPLSDNEYHAFFNVVYLRRFGAVVRRAFPYFGYAIRGGRIVFLRGNNGDEITKAVAWSKYQNEGTWLPGHEQKGGMNHGG